MTRIALPSALAAALVTGALLGTGPTGATRAETVPSPPEAPATDVLFVGTGPVVGIYFPAGGAVCRMVNHGNESEGLRCAIESTNGSIENIAELRRGRLDMAVAQSDWQHHAYEGTGPFEADGPFEELRSVFAIHGEPITLVAHPDAEIEAISDLKGKRVNIGPPGSGQYLMAEMLFDALDWELDDFAAVSEVDPNELPQALCAGEFDAFLLPAAHPGGVIHEAIQGCGATLIDVAGPEIDRLIAERPYMTRSVIPAGLYPGVEDEVVTFGVRATLVTTARLEEETVYAVVAAVFEEFDRFKAMHPAFATLTPEAMIDDGNSAPIHPGALRYYEERDWR